MSQFVPSDAAEGDFFGNSVAISGRTVIIGAVLDDSAAGFNHGSAYVFERVLSPADLNEDGVVGTLDLGILLSSWSIPPTVPGCGGAASCPADLNGDGTVNSIDLGILLSAWTL